MIPITQSAAENLWTRLEAAGNACLPAAPPYGFVTFGDTHQLMHSVMGTSPASAEHAWNSTVLWPAGQYNELQTHPDLECEFDIDRDRLVQVTSPLKNDEQQAVAAEAGQLVGNASSKQAALNIDSEDLNDAGYATETEGTDGAGALSALPRLVWSSGAVCMLLAAFIFSLSALFVKLTAGRVPVLQITLIRSSLSWIVSAVAIKARQIQPMFGQRKHVIWLIARGVTGALAMISFYVAILMLPLADAMTLFFLNPCMTAIAAWAIRGEPLGLLGITGCSFSLAGMLVLTHPPMLFGGHEEWGLRRVLGTLLGVTAAVWATGAFISIRFIGKAEPAIVVALYFHSSTMLLSGVPLLIGWPSHPVWMSCFDTALLVGVAVTSFAGQLFLTRGFQLESAGKAAGLNFSQVLYSYIFGIAFFHEHLSVFGVLGTVLIALGMACVTARPAAEQPTNKLDQARSTAADGMGSRIFGRFIGNSSNSSGGNTLAERNRSFLRLLARARGGSSGGSGSSSAGGYKGLGFFSRDSGSQITAEDDSEYLLRIEEELSWQDHSNRRDSSRGGERSTPGYAAAAAAGDAELVAIGAAHLRHTEQQQQQVELGAVATAAGDADVLSSCITVQHNSIDVHNHPSHDNHHDVSDSQLQPLWSCSTAAAQ